MVRKGQVNPVTAEYYTQVEGDTLGETPWEYQKDRRSKQIENFTKAVGHADWLKDFQSPLEGNEPDGSDEDK